MPDRFDKAVNVSYYVLYMKEKMPELDMLYKNRHLYVEGQVSSRFLAPNPNESAQRKRKQLAIQYSQNIIDRERKIFKLVCQVQSIQFNTIWHYC